MKNTIERRNKIQLYSYLFREHKGRDNAIRCQDLAYYLDFEETEVEEVHGEERIKKMYPVGIALATYIICENEDGMYIIDSSPGNSTLIGTSKSIIPFGGFFIASKYFS